MCTIWIDLSRMIATYPMWHFISVMYNTICLLTLTLKKKHHLLERLFPSNQYFIHWHCSLCITCIVVFPDTTSENMYTRMYLNAVCDVRWDRFLFYKYFSFGPCVNCVSKGKREALRLCTGWRICLLSSSKCREGDVRPRENVWTNIIQQNCIAQNRVNFEELTHSVVLYFRVCLILSNGSLWSFHWYATLKRTWTVNIPVDFHNVDEIGLAEVLRGLFRQY